MTRLVMVRGLDISAPPVLLVQLAEMSQLLLHDVYLDLTVIQSVIANVGARSWRTGHPSGSQVGLERYLRWTANNNIAIILAPVPEATLPVGPVRSQESKPSLRVSVRFYAGAPL